MIVAFDFDGTLTDKDTILGFFLHGKSRFRPFKLLLYFAGMCFCKVKLISNDALKKLGVQFFLEGMTKAEIERIAAAYAATIQLNAIHTDHLQPLKIKPYIISASFTEYLQVLFPQAIVIGSLLAYDQDGKVSGIALNCYKERKVTVLLEKGIQKIDTFYTDNIVADGPLVRIADQTVVVQKGEIRQKISVG